jgi:hypothetical protein
MAVALRRIARFPLVTNGEHQYNVLALLAPNNGYYQGNTLGIVVQGVLACSGIKSLL